MCGKRLLGEAHETGGQTACSVAQPAYSLDGSRCDSAAGSTCPAPGSGTGARSKALPAMCTLGGGACRASTAHNALQKAVRRQHGTLDPAVNAADTPRPARKHLPACCWITLPGKPSQPCTGYPAEEPLMSRTRILSGRTNIRKYFFWRTWGRNGCSASSAGAPSCGDGALRRGARTAVCAGAACPGAAAVCVPMSRGGGANGGCCSA